MVEIVCDDKKIEKALRKLCELVTENGGIVHDKLTIGSKNGDLIVNVAESVPRGEKILVLPKECLLPVDKFDLRVEGNDMVIISHDDDLSKGRVALMEAMLDLYNLTGKVETQRKTSTLSLYYKDKEFLDLLLESRSENAIPFLKKIKDMDKEEFYLDGFFKSRVLGFKELSDAPHEGEEKGFKRTQVLMPIVDFLNHHSRAVGYISRFADPAGPDVKQGAQSETDLDGIAVVKSCSEEGSNECFVHYGPYDALDAMLHYNYADRSAVFTRSVPVDIELPGGRGVIKIRSATGRHNHKKLPAQLKDLTFYIPSMGFGEEKNIIELGFIYIPPKQAPRSMRRVLVLAINNLGLGLNEAQVMEYVLFAEKMIIDKNLKYFNKLSAYLDVYSATPETELIVKNAQDAVAIQLRNIRDYAFFNETQDVAPKKKKVSV